jgi:hypothetical protein
MGVFYRVALIAVVVFAAFWMAYSASHDDDGKGGGRV